MNRPAAPDDRLSEFVVIGGSDGVTSWLFLKHPGGKRPCDWYAELDGIDIPLTDVNAAAVAHLADGCPKPRNKRVRATTPKWRQYR